MMILKMLTFVKRMSAWKNTERTTNIVETIVRVLAFMYASHSGCMKLAPLAPFITRK